MPVFASMARWTLRQARRLDQPCLRTGAKPWSESTPGAAWRNEAIDFLSRRAQNLNVVLPASRTGEPLHLVIDSTGLKRNVV